MQTIKISNTNATNPIKANQTDTKNFHPDAVMEEFNQMGSA